MSKIREKAIQGFKVGDAFTVIRQFSEEDTQKFAAITCDYNPVHFDERFAGVKKFNGRICHGLLVASMITEIGGQIGWLASGMNFRFKLPVYFGDTIECTLTITEIDPNCRAKAEAVYQNQEGNTVLEAELFGILPGLAAQEVLKAMVAEGDPTNELR
ncbi:MAG: MaoC family dehydratase [Desulfobacterales bacterium]|nr:MAG: MaoC family dehydratase [Desulfobacterales bacterium]